MHENYIEAGVDVITTNTYASARHNVVPLGLNDSVTELNLRAVMLAQDARDRCAKERPVYIAGSVSNFGLITGAEPGTKGYLKSYFIQSMDDEVFFDQGKNGTTQPDKPTGLGFSFGQFLVI